MGVLMAHAQIKAVGVRVVKCQQLHAIGIATCFEPSGHEGLERGKFFPCSLVKNRPAFVHGVPVATVEHVHCQHFRTQKMFHCNPVDAKVAIIWHVNSQGLLDVVLLRDPQLHRMLAFPRQVIQDALKLPRRRVVSLAVRGSM